MLVHLNFQDFSNNMTDIVIIGTGYVGLVSGIGFATYGHNVICVDKDEKKIERLNKGELTIYEPELSKYFDDVRRNNKIHFSSSIEEVMKTVPDVVICAVGTPSNEDGSVNLDYVRDVTTDVAQYSVGPYIYIIKSTVPPGTTDEMHSIIKKLEKVREVEHLNGIAFTPEFLREGYAIKDFMQPSRTIVGCDDEVVANSLISTIFSKIESEVPPIHTSIKAAEMIKYASNAMLATRISFMNEIAQLCDAIGVDVRDVAYGMGFDDRIGPKFLKAGCGYGGSCFPKDVKGLIHLGQNYNIPMDILTWVHITNDYMKTYMINKLIGFVPLLNGKTITFWGVAFKPFTDDIRESPALEMIKSLQNLGCKIKCYDKWVTSETMDSLKLDSYATKEDALKDADILFVCTEAPEFRKPDWDEMKSLMNGNIICDCRNIYMTDELHEQGFVRIGIGS